MPVRSTPEQAVAKWLQNLGSATDRMTSGAQRVTVAPNQKAAQAADKWLQRVTAAKPKYIAGNQRVDLATWQAAYINVGIPRVSQGAQAKQAKMLSFQNEFLPYLARGTAQIDNMPSTTLEDNIARATAMIRYNAKFQRGKSG